MTDRLAGIRARLDDAPITIHGPEPLVRWLEQKDSDIAWLIGEVQMLRKMLKAYRDPDALPSSPPYSSPIT
jgi:hypothetical protein